MNNSPVPADDKPLIRPRLRKYFITESREGKGSTVSILIRGNTSPDVAPKIPRNSLD